MILQDEFALGHSETVFTVLLIFTVCQFIVAVTGSAAGQYTNTTESVTSTNGGTGNTASANLTVVSVATHFGVSAPASAISGTSFNFTVTALDSSNKVVPSYTGTVH